MFLNNQNQVIFSKNMFKVKKYALHLFLSGYIAVRDGRSRGAVGVSLLQSLALD